MWPNRRQITGGVWLALGAVLLFGEMSELPGREFGLDWSYYLVAWGYPALCILGGILLLTGMPLGRWLITALALLLAAHAVTIWDKAERAPFSAKLWCVSMFTFAAWSIFVVHRRND
jgi:hypothetical protein